MKLVRFTIKHIWLSMGVGDLSTAYGAAVTGQAAPWCSIVVNNNNMPTACGGVCAEMDY